MGAPQFGALLAKPILYCKTASFFSISILLYDLFAILKNSRCGAVLFFFRFTRM